MEENSSKAMLLKDMFGAVRYIRWKGYRMQISRIKCLISKVDCMSMEFPFFLWFNNSYWKNQIAKKTLTEHSPKWWQLLSEMLTHSKNDKDVKYSYSSKLTKIPFFSTFRRFWNKLRSSVYVENRIFSQDTKVLKFIEKHYLGTEGTTNCKKKFHET